MVDLTSVEAGDIIVLRCGGKLKVEPASTESVVMGDKHWNCYWPRKYKGFYTSNREKHPFDIVAIEKQPKPKEYTMYVLWGLEPDGEPYVRAIKKDETFNSEYSNSRFDFAVTKVTFKGGDGL